MMQVTCRDNGQGMHHKDIPNMLGRVLSGTKYGVKQTRGKFGLGAKMALLWYVLSDPAASTSLVSSLSAASPHEPDGLKASCARVHQVQDEHGAAGYGNDGAGGAGMSDVLSTQATSIR
jgi:hypothetical protein